MPSFSLHIPMPHGKEDSMKTPMDSSDNHFPKKTQFNHIFDQQVQSVMEKLNNRLRKCLGMKTPNQVFFKDCSFVALRS